MHADSAAGTLGTGLSVRLLGAFELSRGTVPMHLPRNATRLVAFLALNLTSPRSVASGVLWPDVSDHCASGSLRTTLWRLSKVCPDLLADADTTLALSGGVEVDVWRLLDLARTAPSVQPPSLRHSEGSSLHLSEELLPGWYDDWVLLERERFRQLSLHVMEATAIDLLHRGQPGAALQAALTVLHTEPLRESAHRLVIRIHLAEGNAVEAIRQYAVCTDLLFAELHVEPSPQLQHLMAGLTPARGAGPTSRRIPSGRDGSREATRPAPGSEDRRVARL